ncbi:TetR/AcrR family transcriptional regulator [Acinetobacter chinensis]|uniref:TetR/AcrR family transcriptional regulator n=1 Tax=Acinetobacter chinensis TaxID=2004650 RepID=UPI0037436A40
MQPVIPKRQLQASQNRADLLEAALKIFRLHGIRAPLQLIIEEAGVGRATFYRNFQDRRALVIALMEQALDRLEIRAARYAPYPDGFLRLIQNHVDNLPYLTALMEYWRVISYDDPVLVEIYQRRDQLLQPLIDQAIAHGVCRADFSSKDYAMITAILRSSFQGMDDEAQRALAKRALDLLIHGIRP